MKACDNCGGIIATEPTGEMISGRLCICGASTLDVMGKDRLTQPQIQILRTRLAKAEAELAEAKDRLAKYEKQWNDMNFTICKLEQDLRKAKGEQ